MKNNNISIGMSEHWEYIIFYYYYLFQYIKLLTLQKCV